MKTLLKALSLATILLFTTAVSAQQAITPIHARNFTFATAGDYGYWWDPVSLASDANGVTKISLGTQSLQREAASFLRTTDGENAFMNFALNANAGYRITGWTVSWKIDGKLSQAEYEGERGFAANRTYLEFRAGSTLEGTEYQQREYDTPSVLSPQSFSFSGQAGGLNSLYMTFNPAVFMEVEGVFGPTQCNDMFCRETYLPSLAAASIKDLVLTVNTVPVPEPETYAMLLGGLVVTGLLARRRQRKAQRQA